MNYKKTFLFVLVTSFCNYAIADDYPTYSMTESFQHGTPGLELRLRHENSRQEELATAKATTLRTTVSYDTAEFNDMKISVALTDVSKFFGQSYNPDVDGLRKPDFTQILDPKGTGITKGMITYTGLENTSIIVGRQYILLDNQRFLGNEDFRQFPQSFDAVTLKTNMINQLDFHYSYIAHVNDFKSNGRTDEGRRKLHTHIANLSWNEFNYGILTGYTYFHKDTVRASDSHVTLGIRATSDENYAEINGVDYTFEFARQQNKFNNRINYKAYYFHANINKKLEMFNATFGYERLGGHKSDQNKSFQTPLGTKHNFQGKADAFLTTPHQGLQDFYIKVSTAPQDIVVDVEYHHFRLTKNSTLSGKTAGQELDITASMQLNDNVKVSTTYAQYNPKNSIAAKVRRFWVMLSANLL